jgi:hypothetical protein
MKASVGDRIVIASNQLDRPLRDGRIVECRHDDGTPPYIVEWADTGQRVLFFPGPDASVQHFEVDEIPAPRSSAASTARHVKSWRVQVDLFEGGDETTAHAVLHAEVPGIEARGDARRNPKDPDVPEIGDEVAVARALRRLSDRLFELASGDIAATEGHPVTLGS